MPTCPNGHQSAADDWCEVCGHRVAEASGTSGGPVPPPPPPPPAAGYGYPAQAQPSGHYPTGPEQGGGQQPQFCPQCRTPREAHAHFCEECRYNFLTGSPTAYPPAQPQGYQQGAAPLDYTDSGRARLNRGAESIPQGGGGVDTSWNLAPPSSGNPAPPPPGQPPYGHQAPPAQGHPGAQEQSYTQGQQPPGQPQHGQPPQYGQGQYHNGAGQPYPGTPEQSYAQGQQPPPPQLGNQGYAQQPGYPQQPQQAQPFASQGAPPQGQQAPQFAPQYQQALHQPPQTYQQGPPPHGGQPGGWQVTVTQDPEYFQAMMERSGPEGTGLQIPEPGPGQQLPLSGHQVTIGRRRQSTGESPDIDLAKAPEDPGVSHQHAVLVQQPDGGWAVVDQDSTNGTTLNGAEDPIQPFIPVTLQDGDRVHVGAWTTITLRRA